VAVDAPEYSLLDEDLNQLWRLLDFLAQEKVELPPPSTIKFLMAFLYFNMPRWFLRLAPNFFVVGTIDNIFHRSTSHLGPK
jgi:hypothetical protein